jgi:hypothetical protein
VVSRSDDANGGGGVGDVFARLVFAARSLEAVLGSCRRSNRRDADESAAAAAEQQHQQADHDAAGAVTLRSSRAMPELEDVSQPPTPQAVRAKKKAGSSQEP